MNDQLQAIATVLSLVNPAICAAIFSKIESGRSSSAKITDAVKAGIAIAVVVTVGVMISVSIFGGKNQGGLVSETITHMMGLIVIAMGVQFGLTGLKSFMA